MVKTKVHWKQDKVRDYTLVTYSQHPMTLKEVSDKSLKKNLVPGYLGYLGNTAPKKTEFKNNCKFATGWDKGFMYMFAENAGPQTWTLTIELSTMTNVKLGKAHRKDDNIVEIEVKPNSWACAYGKRIDPKVKTAIDWKFKHAYA